MQNTGDGNLSGQGATSNLNGNFASGAGVFSGAGAALSLADGASQLQQYSFTPTNRGSSTLNVNVATGNGKSDGSNQAQTFSAQLSGTGVGPLFASSIISGSTINFGTLSSPGSLALNVSNSTTDPDLGALTALTLLSFSITGPNPNLFSLTNFTPSTQLAKNASLALGVGFSASSNGVGNATLTLFTDEGAALGASGLAFSYTLAAAAVPEPVAAQMFSVGLICFGLVFLRKRRSAHRGV